MEHSSSPSIPSSILASIPRQGGSPAAAGEHWLVARLHEERQAADRARLSELLAGAGSPLVEGVRRTSASDR